MALDITIVQAKFAIARGRNSSRAMELLCCDSGIIRFAENSIASCEQSGSHSGSDSKTNPHLHPLPLGKGEAKSNARSVREVTSAYGMGKLHTELTRGFQRLAIWDNRIPGALPQGSPQRMEPQGRERHGWVKPRGRNERERVSKSVPWRTRTRECL
jgi:hypothetical protein